jgi:two-component system, NarL family, sensor histidine kinase DegS
MDLLPPKKVHSWTMPGVDSVERRSNETHEAARERPVWVTNAILLGVLGGLLAAAPAGLRGAAGNNWLDILFWGFVVALVNLFPVRVQNLTFTLDAPLVLAVAFLYSPPLASLLAVFATIDLRELRGQMEPSYAVFNRLQTGVSVYLASATFHSITGELQLHTWEFALLGAMAALVVDYLVNVTLILGGYVERRGQLRTAARNLHVGNPVFFLGTYVGYGLLALLLAYLFREVGGWSVVTFLVPILVAQQMLVRTQELERLAEDLRGRERLIQGLFDRAIDERRDERLRISGELHDTVLQSLTKIWMLGSLLKRQPQPSPQAIADLRELVGLADRTIEELRRLMREMRQSPIGTRGLVPTLEGLIRDLRLDWKTRIDLEASDDLELPPKVQVVAYQVAREALLNSLKHADASHVTVRLEACSNGIRVQVDDNGKGFDPTSRPPLHFGLQLLEERVATSGGKVTLESGHGQGTRLQVTLPTTKQAHSVSA